LTVRHLSEQPAVLFPLVLALLVHAVDIKPTVKVTMTIPTA
jgi:hypothetical protein